MSLKIALHKNCINPMKRTNERVIADVWTPIDGTDDCIESEITGISNSKIAVDYKFSKGDHVSFYCLGCHLNIKAEEITFKQSTEYLNNPVESTPYKDIIMNRN